MGVVPVVDGAWPHGTQRVSIRNRLLPRGATPSASCTPCSQDAAGDNVPETQGAKHDSFWRMNAIHEEEQDASTSSNTRLLDLGAVVTAMAHLVAPKVCLAWQLCMCAHGRSLTRWHARATSLGSRQASVFICMAVWHAYKR